MPSLLHEILPYGTPSPQSEVSPLADELEEKDKNKKTHRDILRVLKMKKVAKELFYGHCDMTAYLW